MKGFRSVLTLGPSTAKGKRGKEIASGDLALPAHLWSSKGGGGITDTTARANEGRTGIHAASS